MLGEVVAAVFEILSDESDSVEVGSHRELVVFALHLLGACFPLGECLVVQGER